VNDSLARLLRRPSDEIVGRPFLTFVHPEQRSDSLACYFQSVVAAAVRPPHQTKHTELRCVAGDGSVLWLAVTWTITAADSQDQQFGILHLSDITDCTAAERARAEAERFEGAIDHAPIGGAVVGADGRFLRADRQRSNALSDHLDNGELAVHQTVKRLLHRGGHGILARRVVAAVRDRDASTTSAIVPIEDITADRQARAELLPGQAQEQSPEPGARKPHPDASRGPGSPGRWPATRLFTRRRRPAGAATAPAHPAHPAHSAARCEGTGSRRPSSRAAAAMSRYEHVLIDSTDAAEVLAEQLGRALSIELTPTGSGAFTGLLADGTDVGLGAAEKFGGELANFHYDLHVLGATLDQQVTAARRIFDTLKQDSHRRVALALDDFNEPAELGRPMASTSECS